MTDQQNPAQIVCNFIASLPPTIKKNVLSFVWIYAARSMPKRKQDFESDISDLLLRSSWPFNLGALICVIAALDYILSDAVADAETREEVAKRTAEEMPSFEKVALGIPLASRHFEAAHEKWLSLREDSLTFEKIQAFERSLQTRRTNE